MPSIQQLYEWVDYLADKQSAISAELEATSMEEKREHLSRKHAEVTAAFIAASEKVGPAIAAQKEEQEKRCSIRATEVTFVPLIQMMAKSGKVEKQESGGVLAHTSFCDKVVKPPNRPMPAFIWFVNEVNPIYCFDQEGVDLAHQWAVVDEATKAKNQVKADEDKIQYQKELAKIPNRPMPAFIWFANEVNPSYCSDQEGIDLARQWAVVDEVTKAKYQDKAEKDKIRYQKELDAQHMIPT